MACCGRVGVSRYGTGRGCVVVIPYANISKARVVNTGVVIAIGAVAVTRVGAEVACVAGFQTVKSDRCRRVGGITIVISYGHGTRS